MEVEFIAHIWIS